MHIFDISYIFVARFFYIMTKWAGAKAGELGRTVNPLAKPEGVRFPPCPQCRIKLKESLEPFQIRTSVEYSDYIDFNSI